VEVSVLTIVACVFGIAGVIFGLRSYFELYRWARQCQRAQIAISYNRKVQLSAPLVEWLLWCNQLKKEEANGRVILRQGKTAVAILRGASPPSRIRGALKLGTRRKSKTRTPPVRQSGRDEKKVAT
jgi:hypothetical protein